MRSTPRYVLICALCTVAIVTHAEGQSNCWKCTQYSDHPVLWRCDQGQAFGYLSCHMSNGVCIGTGQCPLTVLPGEISAAGTVNRKLYSFQASVEQRLSQSPLRHWQSPILADIWRVDCKGRVIYRSMTFATARKLRKDTRLLLV